MAKSAFTGQLYQLSSARRLPAGTFVAVNGPWDTFGAVLKSEPLADNTYLNLIRGVPARPGVKPSASF